MKYAIILLVLLSFGCKKEEEQFGNITYFQSEYLGKNTYLYIDGKAQGVLNSTFYLDSNGYTPNCEDDVFPYVKTVKLPYGTHKYWMRYANESYDTFTLEVKYPCQIVKVPE